MICMREEGWGVDMPLAIRSSLNVRVFADDIIVGWYTVVVACCKL